MSLTFLNAKTAHRVVPDGSHSCYVVYVMLRGGFVLCLPIRHFPTSYNPTCFHATGDGQDAEEHGAGWWGRQRQPYQRPFPDGGIIGQPPGRGPGHGQRRAARVQQPDPRPVV